PEVLHGFGLHVNVVSGDTEDLGDACLHLRKVRKQLRALGENVRIDVADFITFLSDEVGSLTKKFQTRNVLVAIAGIWKPCADIAGTAAAQQCVTDGM